MPHSTVFQDAVFSACSFSLPFSQHRALKVLSEDMDAICNEFAREVRARDKIINWKTMETASRLARRMCPIAQPMLRGSCNYPKVVLMFTGPCTQGNCNCPKVVLITCLQIIMSVKL